MKSTAAGRLELIMSLLDPNDYDEYGNVVGQHEPLITKEQAMLMIMGEIDEPSDY